MPEAPSEFRFLVLCGHVRRRGQAVSLDDVLNVVHAPVSRLPYELELVAAIGVVLLPPMWGKRLDLVAWRFGPGGKQATVSCTGTSLVLPQEAGTVVVSYPLTVHLRDWGIHGFDLLDSQAAFGPAGRLLASYQYTVFGVEPPGSA